MIKNLFSGRSLINVIAFTLFVLYINVTAQSIPPNTRLMQVNTVKGSALSIVETSGNFTYHVGTANSGEIGIDGLSAPTAGLDDLFILKSHTTTGANSWLKTFDAGSTGVITPRKIYADASQNVYVFAQFSGTITAGSTTVTSGAGANSFLMKLDPAGNALWIKSFATTDTSALYAIKFASDANDLFMIFSQNHLVRINILTGNVIYDNVYSPATDLRGIALKNTNIYVAGVSQNGYEIFGSESTEAPGLGFILKGDKSANFTASMHLMGGALAGADVGDIAFASDGYLLLTGFHSSEISLRTESGIAYYTYNPNTSFEGYRLYHYTAKIDSDLAAVSFFRTSTPISSDASYRIEFRNFSSKIIPFATAGMFKTIVSLGFYNGRNSISNFTGSNSSATTVANTGSGVYQLLSSYSSTGSYDGLQQPQAGGTENSFFTTSGTFYLKTTKKSRLFATTAYNGGSGSVIWSKEKNSSIGGALSLPFHQHLNNAKNDLFVTSIVEGKANFFGKQVTNVPGVSSRYVTRLGIDGLPKWFARFHPDSGVRELNTSSDFSCVDQDDNFIFLANTSGGTSTFIDAAGNFADFNQSTAVSAKAIIKLDQNGNLLWSKQILPTQGANMPASVSVDGNGNIHVIGTTTAGFSIDGISVPATSSNTIFLVKISSGGTILYAKSYQNVSAYSLLPVFDAQNNLYVFSEPINPQQIDYVFDGVTLPTTPDFADLLMLKFNNSGDVIFGKNFYAGLPEGSSGYAWPNDVVFDGSNFLMMGNYYSWNNAATSYNGLDLALIPKVYSPETFIPLFAKIKTDGSVLWQKPYHLKQGGTGSYTNIGIDENKNTYMYWYVKDKMTVNGVEYTFDAAVGNKVFTKIDTDGNLIYNRVVDVNTSSYPMIDVIGNDKVNISSFTSSNNILNYPVINNRASNFFIATFGNLDSYYLTPTKEYLELNNLEMTNNPDNANTFSFDLINNVNWTANSDNSWLNLSFQSLAGKYDYKNLISGNGDAKIVMSAQTNTSGANRTANVMVSGDSGVSPKTIAITQSAVLASGETKTFVTTIYPNPTSDILNIETKQKISKIEIFDMSGRLLKTADGKDKKVSVSQLNKGIYIILLHTENGVENSKFIKN